MILFGQDAIFKLIFDHEKDVVAFQKMNLPDYFYLTLDNESDASLVRMKLERQITINKFDNRFLFKIILAT
jgi:hypothetical protein